MYCSSANLWNKPKDSSNKYILNDHLSKSTPESSLKDMNSQERNHWDSWNSSRCKSKLYKNHYLSVSPKHHCAANFIPISPINLLISLLMLSTLSKLLISQLTCIWLKSCIWFISFLPIQNLSRDLCLIMEPETPICQKDWRIVTFWHATSTYNMKRLKLTLNSSSPMLLIERKWPNLKENSQTRDAERSSNSREKFVKVMISLLLLSTKRVLTPSVWKHLPTKKLSLLEEPKEETWRELFWLVVDQQSTLLRN